MRIAILHSSNPGRKAALNKDLNGGLGTADDFGRSWGGRLMRYLKWRYIGFSVLSAAHLQAILKRQGHQVHYYEDAWPDEPFDLGLLYGSMVDFRNENGILARLRDDFPAARVGVFGPFPARFPETFPQADFVIGGEPEAFFLYDEIDRLTKEDGLVGNDAALDLDDLPAPDFAGFPFHRYSYAPMLPRNPYLFLLTSKGCPFSCRYYCSYGEYQGASVRQRSAVKVYQDMLHLRRTWGVRSIQFRDPLFGLNRRFVLELCQYLRDAPLGIEWGIETRADLLVPSVLDQMYEAGLRSINFGVETTDKTVASASRRKLVEQDHQDAIFAHVRRLGIRINTFLMFGLEKDTPESLRATTKYALSLNPTAARFSVSTPYPGTGFHDQLMQEGRIVEGDWEQYTQFSLVYRHGNLTPDEVQRHLVRSYLRFYLRPSYVLKTLFNVWRSNSRLFADNRAGWKPSELPERAPAAARAST